MRNNATIKRDTKPGTDSLWPVLLLLTNATMWTVTSEMLPSGLLPAMSRDLNVSEGMIGSLVSAWALTIALASYPLVRLTTHVRRTPLLSHGLVVMALANLLVALAPDFPTAFVGRVITAAAHGLFWALVVAYLASIVPPKRLGRSLAIVLSGPTIAGLIGLPLATYLAGVVGWRAVTGALSVAFVLTAAALWRVLPETGSSTSTDEPTGAWDESGPRVLRVAIGGAFVLVGHFAAFTFITAIITRFVGLGDDAIPRILLILGIAGVFGIAVSGILADRYPEVAIWFSAGLLTLSLALIYLSGQFAGLFLVGVVVWGFAIAAFPPVFQAGVLRVASPKLRPLAGGIVVTSLNLGIAIGAGLGGLLLGYGLTVVLVMAIMASAIGTVILSITKSSPPL